MSLQKTLDVVRNSSMPETDKQKIVNLLTLLSKSSIEMTAGELAAARIAAGLSVGQAARKLDMPVSHLLMYEGGGWDRGKPAFQASLFDELYGLTPREFEDAA